MAKTTYTGRICTTAIYLGVGATWLISAYFKCNERGFILSNVKARLLGIDIILSAVKEYGSEIRFKQLASVGTSCNTIPEVTELFQSLLPTIQSELDEIYQKATENGSIIERLEVGMETNETNFIKLIDRAFGKLETPDPDEDQWI